MIKRSEKIYTCFFCGRTKIRNAALGIWQSGSCKKIVTGVSRPAIPP
uniref:Uncharacterized protein n=1 Tax=Dromaius novaehollandiae TaxID=8790 RepID=A0A8C4K5I0_DRONO